MRLLEEHEDVRSYYQNKFRYVLIDEYQDTNNLQYRLAAALAGFDQTADRDLLEYYLYEISALRAKHTYLLRQMRSLERQAIP